MELEDEFKKAFVEILPHIKTMLNTQKLQQNTEKIAQGRESPTSDKAKTKTSSNSNSPSHEHDKAKVAETSSKLHKPTDYVGPEKATLHDHNKDQTLLEFIQQNLSLPDEWLYLENQLLHLGSDKTKKLRASVSFCYLNRNYKCI